jgi:hypothetical protein
VVGHRGSPVGAGILARRRRWRERPAREIAVQATPRPPEVGDARRPLNLLENDAAGRVTGSPTGRRIRRR